MSYCEIGVEAQVLYTLDGAKKRFTTKQTPIDVQIIQLPIYPPPGGGQDPNALYGVVYNVTPNSVRWGFGYNESGIGNVSGRITKAVVEYGYIDTSIFYPNGRYTQDFIVENDKGFRYTSNISPNGDNYGAYVFNRIVRQDGIPEDPNPNTPRCEIQVSHYGQLLHSNRGSCPITFEVLCGEQCPEGYLKCDTDTYPFFCCIECEPIVRQIKDIKTRVDGLNDEAVANG